MAQMVGTYQHQSSENLDAFFSAVGVPWIARKMMAFTSPRVEVSQDDDTFTVVTQTLVKTLRISFKLDEPFEDALMNGEKTQNVIRKEGDSLVQQQDSTKGQITITRTFTDDAMDMTLEHKDVKATRHFKRMV